MSAIPSTAGSQAAMQAAFQQLKLQQARQNAERAEQTARALESKAAEAQQVAERADENARSLSVQSSQARSIAGRARQGVAMTASIDQMRVQLGNTVSQSVERRESASLDAPVAETAPVRNLSGQVTGTLVNTTA